MATFVINRANCKVPDTSFLIDILDERIDQMNKYIEKDCLRLFIKEYGDVVSMIDEAVRVGLRKW